MDPDLAHILMAMLPDLKLADFSPSTNHITLTDLSDGAGPFILEWIHPTVPRPTDEEIAAFTEAHQ